jgi:hypothetical protein
MQMIKFPRAFGLAAIAAMIVLGVPQAAAQGLALGHSARAAPGATGPGGAGPDSLPWIRYALAHAPSHQVSPKITIGNFSDCPSLPTGFDPSQFLCVLIHITGGQLQIGHSNQIISKNITVPFAEGTDPSGNTVLVAGILRSAPMPVLGGIFLQPLVDSITQTDPNLQLSVKPVGVGMAIDPTGNTPVIISQKIKAINPVFGSTCFVGSKQTPITLDPTFGTTSPPPPNQPISGHIDSVSSVGNEIVIIGTVVDNAFAAPGAQGCGPGDSLSQVVDEVGALPSPAGTNTAIFQVTAEAISYSNI